MGIYVDYFRARDSEVSSMDVSQGLLTPHLDSPNCCHIDGENYNLVLLDSNGELKVFEAKRLDPEITSALVLVLLGHPEEAELVREAGDEDDHEGESEDCEVGEGPWIFRFSDEFRDACTQMDLTDETNTDAIATEWYEAGMPNDDLDCMGWLLRRFQTLGKLACRDEQHIYCWVCL